MSGPARHMWPKLWEWQVLHYGCCTHNLIKKRGSNAEICSSFIVSAPRTKWWIPWSCSGSTVHPQVVEIIKSFEDGDGWRLNETWVDGLCSFSNGGKRSLKLPFKCLDSLFPGTWCISCIVTLWQRKELRTEHTKMKKEGLNCTYRMYQFWLNCTMYIPQFIRLKKENICVSELCLRVSGLDRVGVCPGRNWYQICW